MNWQQMIEFCLDANVNRGEPFIRPLLNIALSIFARETKMLKTSTTATMDTDTTTWSLPADCIEVDRVVYTDTDGVPRGIYRTGTHKHNLHDNEYTYWIVGRVMYLGKMVDQVLTGVDGTFTIEYTKGFTELESDTTLSEEPDLPLEFRRGICAKVREDLVGSMEERAVEMAIWKDCLKRGIKYAQQHADGSDLQVLIHEL